jgi:methionyl-tRNA formyltransferase
MHVALLCATRRGQLFLDLLTRLLPDASLLVFSFAEEPWEPPFLEDIRRKTESVGGTFVQGKHVGSSQLMPIWQANSIDIMFAVNWRYYVPPTVYRRVRHGAYVFHDSLLPKYRGFSPTVWAM